MAEEAIDIAQGRHALLLFGRQQITLQGGFGLPDGVAQLIEQVGDSFALGNINGILAGVAVDDVLGGPAGGQYEGHKEPGNQQVTATNAAETEALRKPSAESRSSMLVFSRIL